MHTLPSTLVGSKDSVVSAPILGRGIGWQQLRAIGRPQNIEPHRHRRADPQRILAVVVIGAFGERVDENVEVRMVQHQPRHDFLKFFGLKDDVELRDRVRSDRLIAEGAWLYGKLFNDRVS